MNVEKRRTHLRKVNCTRTEADERLQIRPGKNCGENERTFWKEMKKVRKGKKYQAGKREEKKWKNFN